MSGGQVMVVLIVLIVAIAGIVKAFTGRGNRGELPGGDRAETDQMRSEMRALKERVAVLERIATDRNRLLEQEIDQLRDS